MDHQYYVYIYILICCVCDQIVAHLYCTISLYIIAMLKLKLPEPWPIQIYKAFTPTRLPKVLSEAAEILDEDITQRCTSGQMIGSDGNHVVQVQSVKEIRLDELIWLWNVTLEVGLGMKLSSPGGCFQKSCNVTGSHVLQWLNLLIHALGWNDPSQRKEEAAESCCNSHRVGRVSHGFVISLLLPRIPHVDPCGAQVFPSMAHGSEDVLELSSKSYKSQPSASRDRHHVSWPRLHFKQFFWLVPSK